MSEERACTRDLNRRLEAVHTRIERAAERVGRDPGGITLVAVSKTFPPDRIVGLAEAGQLVYGENRIQEAREKVPAVEAIWTGATLTWRLVGHLQRNKVKLALELFQYLDAVDSFRLLDEVEKQAARLERTVPLLLQFNCSGEETKGGFHPREAPEVARRIQDLVRARPEGLMTIGPLSPDPEAARPAFRRLREVGEEMADRLGYRLPHLSMGMSGDLEIGIEEGATLVRVGSALFGPRG